MIYLDHYTKKFEDLSEMIEHTQNFIYTLSGRLRDLEEEYFKNPSKNISRKILEVQSEIYSNEEDLENYKEEFEELRYSYDVQSTYRTMTGGDI